MSRCKSLLLTAAVALLFTPGCGSKEATIEGTITVDGSPLQGATLTFYPDDPKKVRDLVTCISDPSGGFKVTAKAGTYNVSVVKMPPGEGGPVDLSNPTEMMGKTS